MKNIAYILFGLLILSCSTQSVSVDYDRGEDFSKIKNYRIEFTENQMSELDINRLSSALKNELSVKGMQFDENSNVVIQIKPYEFISQSQDSQVGIGVGGGNYGFGTSVGIGIPINSEKLNQEYQVSIYNSENRLVWDARLDIQMPAKANPELMDANIQKGVQKLFKNYPPKK